MKKFAGFLFFFSVLGTFAVSAQTPQMSPQQQQQKVEVSDAELEKFAQAFQGVRVVSQQAQQQMTAVVQESGMDVQKFNEIYQASMDPEVEVEATQEEMKKYKETASKLEEMQIGFQGQMEEIITDQDLTLERYEQIAMGIQTDPELQERLRAVFEG